MDDFEQVRAGFDAVSKLQPPGAESPARPGPVFGHAFDDLVRSVVRDYLENDLSEDVRTAVLEELEAHRESGGAARKKPRPAGKKPRKKAAKSKRK